MSEKRFFPELTSLKGLFILIILFHNTSLVNPVFQNIPGIAYIELFGGDFGNSMFFMLSGFLLSIGYRNRIVSGSTTFQSYMLRRLAALYPLYLITNLVSLLIAVFRYGASGIQLEKLVFTLLLQNGGGLTAANPYNAPTWFVSALLVCYAAYYAISRGTPTESAYRCLLFAGIAWGYTLVTRNLPVPYCFVGNGIGFMNFFIGCIFAEYWPWLTDKKTKWLRPAAVVLLLGIAYLFLHYGVEIISGNVHSAAAFAVNPLIVYLALSDGLFSKFLRLRPLVYLGKISSAIFFWHLPLCYLLQDLLASGEALNETLYIVYLFTVLLCSALSHRLIEKRKKGTAVAAGKQKQ